MNLTADQRRAIETIGCDLLVSAGAGSGKTSVLVSRCLHLITHALPLSSVDRLLVVTFTDAAAAQLRSRIDEELNRHLASHPQDRRVREQLALLDAASISTLHAFCKRVLTRHFAAAGVDPGFTLLDEHEADLLRDEAMTAMLDELLAERAKHNANSAVAVGRASSPDTSSDSLHPGLSQRRAAGARRRTAQSATADAAQGTFDWDRSAAPGPAEKTLRDAFEELRHLYGAGRDDRIRAVVLSLYNFFGSLPDPENWLADVRARFSSLSPTCLTDEWRRVWIEALSETLADLHDGFSRLAADAQADDATRRVGELAEQIAQQIESWRPHVTADAGPAQLDRILLQIRSYQFPKAPRTTEKLAHVEQTKKQLGKLRDEFDKRLRNVDAGHSEADWAEGLSRIAPHVETILALEHRFAAHYAAAKRALNALDFADLERRTLDLLRTSPKTAVWLRNWYEHVLVDEFQDINPIQNEILQHVSRALENNRAGNLFCVGDVKQSIYRFRLADPGIFTERRNRFCDAPGEGPGLRIALSDNFRSRPPVLAAINGIMARLMTPELGGVEYDDRTRLRPGKTDPPAFDGPPVELHLLDAEADARTVDEPDDEEDEDAAGPPPEKESPADWDRIEREAYFIAQRIRLLREQDSGVHFRDIVILMRSAAKRLPLLVRSLQRLGIPVHAERSGGFFDAVEVRDMLAVLSLLDNARQDIPLAAVLRSSLCAFPQDGRRNLPLAHSDLVAIRLHRPGASFHEAAQDYVLHGPDASLRELLSRLFARIRGWRESLRRDTLADLIAGIYAETNYPEYLAGQIDGPQRRANLFALHERARQFSRFAKQGLHRFCGYLEDLQARDDDLAAGAPLSAAADVVRVMTIHGSKGLEFPFVFLVEAGKQFNPSDYSQSIVFDRMHGIGLKAVDAKRRITWPTLAHRRVARRLRMEGLSEELRLLYVAMTRAQRAVFIVGTAAASKIDAFERGDERPPGALPLSRRRTARSMLDWVLDAVAAGGRGSCRAGSPGGSPSRLSACAAEPPGPLFSVHRYRIEDIPASGLTASVPDVGVKLLASAAALQPLDNDPPLEDEAREAARQRVTMLDRRYALEPLVAIPSVAAVTELKHRWTQVSDPDGELAALSAAVSPPPAEWRQPSARTTAAPAPTERGLWTHLFLQHVDLSAACDAADLQRQLQCMVERGLFRPDEAAHVGLDDIAWHLDQPLGRDLRGNSSRVRRELPFVLAVEPARYAAAATAADGGDFILVRGVIDCLYPGPDGLVIIDWKTDVVADAGFDERVAGYRPQLEIYDRAARELFGQPVRARHLVFVTMRRVVNV